MEEQIILPINDIPHDVNNCECCAHENNNNVDDTGTTVASSANQQPDLQSMLSDYPSLVTLARGVSPGMSNSALSEVMKFANTEEGKKLADSLKKKGVKRKQAVRDYRNMKRNMKSVMGNKTPNSTTNTSDITDRKCKVVLLTSGRKLKEKTFQFLKLRENICSILHCTNPTELCCSSLSRGSLTNKEIRVWYDDTSPVKNKRLTRLLGFPCTGEAIIVCYESDITISDIEDVESLCSNNT